MADKIGLLVGWEQSFPQAFLERCNKVPGVRAEIAKIGGTPERFESPYRVLIDRISQEVKHYRFHLKAAALGGAFVINDPFWWSADDKFFGYSLASQIGIATPRTVMLPQRDYIPAIVKERSLRNLEYPLNWEAIIDYVRFPAILKPADGGGWKDVSVVRSQEELLAAYNASGQNVMTLQEFIDFDDYVRCICIGKDRILPIQYDPKAIGPTGLRGCYVQHDSERWLPKALHDRVIEDAIKINRALGYDMNSVEFAIRDGVPYAIDFTNPAPDMHIEHLRERYFNIAVDWMVAFAVECARGERRTRDSYAWSRLVRPSVEKARPGASS
ncbi:ATP-grasp domain-containing protein [Sorangium sp. So ce1151]|uniref:ATP-grasp domain-containing protein n=1 Tax=Sorangium sp. So ce1151 TaxID=3133332 RepID=UPI003F60155D